MPILIGALHTYVHFTDLAKDNVKETLSSPIIIMGTEQPIWNTWGLVSFMMGVSFIIIGLLNLAAIKNNIGNYPPVLNIVVMIIYLACVIYAARIFGAAEQFYGGIVGMFLSIICLGLTLKGSKM